MPKIRAKFKCSQTVKTEYGIRASLAAVHSNTGENQDFAKATPFGELVIQVDKDTNAAQFFEPGKSYYLDFQEAE